MDLPRQAATTTKVLHDTHPQEQYRCTCSFVVPTGSLATCVERGRGPGAQRASIQYAMNRLGAGFRFRFSKTLTLAPQTHQLNMLVQECTFVFVVKGHFKQLGALEGAITVATMQEFISLQWHDGALIQQCI